MRPVGVRREYFGMFYVVFRGQRQSTKVLAVYMVVSSLDDNGNVIDSVEIGDISGLDSDNRSVYKLKLLYSDQSRPNQSGVWELMWRNCYALPRNVSAEDLEVKIYKGLYSSTGEMNIIVSPLIKILPNFVFLSSVCTSASSTHIFRCISRALRIPEIIVLFFRYTTTFLFFA